MCEVKSHTTEIGNQRNPYDGLVNGERKKRVVSLLAGVYLRMARQQREDKLLDADGQLAFDWQAENNRQG